MPSMWSPEQIKNNQTWLAETFKPILQAIFTAVTIRCQFTINSSFLIGNNDFRRLLYMHSNTPTVLPLRLKGFMYVARNWWYIHHWLSNGGCGKNFSALLCNLIVSGVNIDTNTAFEIVLRAPHNSPKAVLLQKLETAESVYINLFSVRAYFPYLYLWLIATSDLM